MNSQELRALQEAYNQVYQQLDEKEDSPYEKASDAALDARYSYGRATGPKTAFGRAANRSSAAAALRAIRRGEISGSGTSREAGADAVHQGWAHTARTSTDQTPEKKAKRAGLANTPYSQLPDDEKEKDRVSFDAVRAVYNRRNQREDFDLYDIILSHLLDEEYADSIEKAEAIMVHMSEEWRESIVEATAMTKRGHDETAIRNKIAKSTGGGKSADRATALENRPTYGDSAKETARQNLARAQRGDFRNTTSSNPGLHGYAYKSNDPDVKAKQAARGAQRGVLTPSEKRKLGR